MENGFRHEQLALTAKHEDHEEEHKVEVSEKEQRLFYRLDIFGKVASEILIRFYDNLFLRDLSQHSVDPSDGVEFDIPTGSLEGLSEAQRNFLYNIAEYVKKDSAEIQKKIDDMSLDELLQTLSKELRIRNPADDFSKIE